MVCDFYRGKGVNEEEDAPSARMLGGCYDEEH